MNREELAIRFKIFITRPITKAVIIGVLTVAIAISTAVSVSPIKWILTAAFSVMYIVFSAIFATHETNYHALSSTLEQENTAYEDALRRVNTICRSSAKSINEKIHEIQTTGLYNPNSWNFKMACDMVCEQLSECLRILLSTGNRKPNIGVGYVRLDETDSTGDTIILCSYFQTRNTNADPPRILGIPRSISNREEYHDADLFQNPSDEAELLLTPDEVGDTLRFRRGTSRKKYKQFIAIPVLCDKIGESKMVGLLEVTSIGDCYFPKDRERTSGYVDDFLRPYAYIVLLLHKMEKALLAVPNPIPQKEDAPIE